MARPSYWRDQSRDVIQAILAQQPKDALSDAKLAALSKAYPFGARRGWAYRAWREEVRAALGLAPLAPRWRPARNSRLALSECLRSAATAEIGSEICLPLNGGRISAKILRRNRAGTQVRVRANDWEFTVRPYDS